MEALEQQENSLLLHLVKQIEDVAKVYIIRLIIVIHLLIENKCLSLKLTNGNFPRQYCLGSIFNKFRNATSVEMYL